MNRSTANLTDAELAAWLEAYGNAWESKLPDAAAALFTEDALYQETPYAEPFRGRGEIRDYWARVTADQDGIRFDFSVISTQGTTGVAQWSSKFRSISGDTQVELNGVFVLEFAESGEVSSLREWWHVR
ncbi:MAG: nuclear transport factor 2 family protein [Gammaproteobacteria bacterium]|nr:nuclear transport factor 2 family protein [Gammaproteobacteria bacterium]